MAAEPFHLSTVGKTSRLSDEDTCSRFHRVRDRNFILLVLVILSIVHPSGISFAEGTLLWQVR
jgi:hypothetical protein